MILYRCSCESNEEIRFQPSNHCGVKYLGNDKIVFEYYRRKSLASPLRREQKTRKELCQLAVCHMGDTDFKHKTWCDLVIDILSKMRLCIINLAWLVTC